MPFNTIEDALAALAKGQMIVVVDDEDRENEGDLILAAEHATPESVAFMVRHTSGMLCVALQGERLDELGLPMMVERVRTRGLPVTAATRTTNWCLTAPAAES